MQQKLTNFLTKKYDATLTKTQQLEQSFGVQKEKKKTHFAFHLFGLRFLTNILEFIIIVLVHPAESFKILKKRDEAEVCSISYIDYRLYSKKLKLLSLGGMSTVVLATLMVSFVVNFIMPNLRVFAATYTYVQDDWRGGADGAPPGTGFPNHTNNRTGWDKYNTKNTALVDTSQANKITVTGSVIVVGDTDADFSQGTISFSNVTGSGASATVSLKITDGTQCDKDSDGYDDNCDGT